jgi:hypothetical protein
VLIEEAVAHAIEAGHVPTLVAAYYFKAHFELVRGDAGAARRGAEIVVKLSQENALALFTAMGALASAWASARLDGGQTGAMRLRQALAAWADQGNICLLPFYQGLLAEIEAQGDAEGALTRIDEALALAGETGEYWSDAFPYRLRGEILLKCDPAHTAPAEDAFIIAIPLPARSRAFRRPRNFPRLLKRKRFSPRSRHEPSRGSTNRSSLRRGRPPERSASRRHGRPTGLVPRVTTSSSYSTGQLATGRLRNLASSVRCCLPVMRRRFDPPNAVRHFVSGF